MKGVSPNIPPETVQPHLRGCGFGACDFEDARRDTQSCVGRDNLDTGHPLGQLASLACCKLLSLLRILTVYRVHNQAYLVGEGFGCTEMGEEVAVGGEDIELVCGPFFVLTHC